MLLYQSLYQSLYHRFDSQECSSFQLFEPQTRYDKSFFMRKVVNPTSPAFITELLEECLVAPFLADELVDKLLEELGVIVISRLAFFRLFRRK